MKAKTRTSVPYNFLHCGGLNPETEKEATELFRRLVVGFKKIGGMVYEQVRLQPPAHARDWEGAERPVADFVIVIPNWEGKDGNSFVVAVEVKKAGVRLQEVIDQAECYMGSTFKTPDGGHELAVDWGAIFPCELPAEGFESWMHRAGLLQIEPCSDGRGFEIKRGQNPVYLCFSDGTTLCRTPPIHIKCRGHQKKIREEKPEGIGEWILK